MSFQWERTYADRTRRIHGSDIRALLKVTSMPGMISLAGGLPAPEAFPIPEFRDAFDRVLREHGAQALQYAASEGFTPLREWIAARLNRQGVDCTSEQILITSGSQQGLDLCGRVFL